MQLQPGMSLAKDRTEVVEKFWRKLEEQTDQILVQHAAEVHAVAQALGPQHLTKAVLRSFVRQLEFPSRR
jgi:hypothetical protein